MRPSLREPLTGQPMLLEKLFPVTSKEWKRSRKKLQKNEPSFWLTFEGSRQQAGTKSPRRTFSTDTKID